ncbi:MAG: Gfo/Idh/MocA family oxidoreductase [Spirochaetaceae bacterium]|jgi:predicted dehydrogenase|nr:Gfo/Idh/MocA family oxidoreductase [Spirochaetaceae bacterium]
MVRLGIIGLGEVAQLMHLPLLADMQDKFKVTAVSDISDSVLDYIASRYSIPHTFKDPEDLIGSKEVDAVMILSPNVYHVRQASLALESGKHVFLEKPAAIYPDELEKLVAVHAKHADVTGMVGYVRRYSELFLKLKELLQKDTKAITYMRARTIVNETGFYVNTTRPVFRPRDLPPEAGKALREEDRAHYLKALGGGMTETQKNIYTLLICSGCHILSAVKELAGLPKAIKTVAQAKNGSHLVITFDYGDFMCVFEEVNDQAVVQFDESIELYQNDRRYYLRYDTPYIRNLPQVLEVTDSTKTSTNAIQYGPCYTDMFTTELNYFYDCIANGKEPKTSFKDSLEDLRLYRDIALKA